MTLILSGTEGISDVDGSAATPAIRGTDTNTGIFFPAADTIAFSEGGVEVMRIDNAGNVGIGTTSPGQKLVATGTIESTSGGFKFPDGTTQTTAASAAIPAGTVLLFYQAAAPTGWTQVTTQNNKALRVVSGTGGGTGGSVAFTTAFASQSAGGTVGATTLSTAQMPSHTHSFATSVTSAQAAPQVVQMLYQQNSSQGTNATGGGGSHDHTFTGSSINLAVQYIDIILASKN
jgi:hypothetical protein